MELETALTQEGQQKKPHKPRVLFIGIYTLADALGTWMIEGCVGVIRRAGCLWAGLLYWVHYFVDFCAVPFRRFTDGIQSFVQEFTDPFSQAADASIDSVEAFRNSDYSTKSVSFRETLPNLKKSYLAALASLCNHVMPILAVFLFIFVLGRSFNQEYLLEVSYDGNVIGYVDNELTYRQAQTMVEERTVFDSSVLLADDESVDEAIAEESSEGKTLEDTSASISATSTAYSATATLSGGLSKNQFLLLSSYSESSEESDEETSRTLQEKETAGKTSFRLVPVSQVEKDDNESLCDKMIEALGDQFVTATGLYVDGTLYGAVEDGNTLNLKLQNILDAADTGEGTVSFYRDVVLREGLYPVNVILSQDTIDTLLASKVSGKKEYKIQSGDAPLSIAAKFDIPYKDFLAMNPDIETTCYVGQTVLIAKEESFLPILVTKQITYKNSVAYTTKTISSSSYYTSYVRITQNGKAGEDTITAKVSYLDGIEVKREIIKTVRTKEPVQQVLIRGTKVAASSGYVNSQGISSTARNKAGFIWPCAGSISCGWWGYYGHRGLDICGRVGIPIWAVADGTVIYAGWKNGGYGYYVLIDHGNGLKTGYMHNSAILVRVGQKVTQGQQIARMGATGWATGPHCHFEVWDNGVLKNPIYYLP